MFDRIMSLPGLKYFYGTYEKHKAALLYIFFGGLTTAVSIGSFIFANAFLHINELIANIISWVLAVLFAYITNRIWVFNSTAKGKKILTEAISFFSGRLLTLGIEETILLIFTTWLKLNGIFVKIAAQFIVLILNYFISKILVFHQIDNDRLP